MASLTLTENVHANHSDQTSDVWFGTEITSVDDYDPEATYNLTGGSVSFTGPGADGAVIVEERLQQEEFFAGAPGYYVHLEQPPNNPQFSIVCTLEYERA